MGFSPLIYSHDLLHFWQSRMYESHWRFNQFEDLNYRYPAGKPVYLQAHRDFIATALASSFDTTSYYLGFFPRPTYVVNENIHLNMEKAYYDQVLKLPRRYLVEFGFRDDQLLYSRPVTFLDLEDEADIEDTARIYVYEDDFDNTISDLFLAFRDRELYDGFINITENNEQYNIPFIRYLPRLGEEVALQGDFAIYIHKSDLAKPSLWNRSIDSDGSINKLDRGLSSNFVTNINVYKKYTNPSKAVMLLSYAGSGAMNPTETEVKPFIIDRQKGWFKLHQNDNISLFGENRPYAVRVSYISGYPLAVSGETNPYLEEAMIRLANANMSTRDIPLSSPSQLIWNKDTQGLYEGTRGYNVPKEYINPLGLLYGHIAAWTIIRQFADEILGNVQGW